MLKPSIFRENIFGESMFDDFFKGFPFDGKELDSVEKELYGKKAARVMKTDVKEKEHEYELVVDIPGFKKDEVKVSLENGFLTIEAAKGLEKDEKEKESGKYIRRERYEGACTRSFYVGENICKEDIKGQFQHGILTLTIPKKEEEKKIEASKYIQLEG